MADERTTEYFQEIAQQGKQRSEELHQVSGPCNCASCTAKRMESIREKVIGKDDPNYYLLSSNPDLWDLAKRKQRGL